MFKLLQHGTCWCVVPVTYAEHMTSTCPLFSIGHELFSLCSKLFIFGRLFPLCQCQALSLLFPSPLPLLSTVAIDPVFKKNSAVFTTTPHILLPPFCASSFRMQSLVAPVVEIAETSLNIFQLEIESRHVLMLNLLGLGLYSLASCYITSLCVVFTIMFKICEMAGFFLLSFGIFG